MSVGNPRFVPLPQSGAYFAGGETGTNPKKGMTISMTRQLVLASTSPRRREILSMAGYRFTVLAPDVDERAPALSPDALVQELSRRKATAAAALAGPNDVILAADTVVALDGKILGKPGDEIRAAYMLRSLSGRTHSVYTGFTILDKTTAITRVVAAQVTMREITQGEIDAYVATGSPLDKAGAYGIQEAAGMFVQSLQGDYYSIMGLPICPVSVLLRDTFGITPDL